MQLCMNPYRHGKRHNGNHMIAVCPKASYNL